MRSSSNPRLIASPCTTRLVEVPIRVTVPPRIETNESGMRYLDAGSSAWSASAMKTGMNTITTAVVMRKGERNAQTRQSTSRRVYLPPRGAVRAHAPMADTRPVLRSPSPSTSIEPTVTVARLDRPDTAWAGVRMPLRRRTTGTAMATWSSRSRSRANRTIAASVRPSTNTMSNVMWRCSSAAEPAASAMCAPGRSRRFARTGGVDCQLNRGESFHGQGGIRKW